MFCVECGKEGPIYKEGVCIDCYIKSHNFTKGPEIIDLPVCSHCDSFKYKNTWTNDLLSDVLRRIIKNTFHISKELKKVDINTGCKEKNEEINCKVYITGFIDDKEITEEHKILVRKKRTVCDICSKRFGGYHEAIVQIRTKKKKLEDAEIKEISKLVEDLVEELQEKGNRGLFITDISEEHGRIDFYISEKGPALAIAKKIQEKYGGSIKQSSKNVGMKDSKQIYKMTYSIRIPGYKKGSFLENNNAIYKIQSIHGNKIKMINLLNWEETSVDANDIEKANIFAKEEYVKEMILINQDDNEVQVMDPKTYKIQIIKKPKKINFNLEKIKVLKIKNHNLLIPNDNGR